MSTRGQGKKKHRGCGNTSRKNDVLAQDKASPERTCVGCRECHHPDALLRLALLPVAFAPWQGVSEVSEPLETIAFDWLGRVPGRGAHVCPKVACVERAIGKGGVKRSFQKTLWLPPVEEVVLALKQGVERRFLERLSLARRAGAIKVGESAVQESMKLSKSLLLILAGDMSPGQQQKYTRNAERKGVTCRVGLAGSVLGGCIRRDFVGCISVEAEPFGKDLLRLSRQMTQAGVVSDVLLLD